jgi:hypothetical protein
MLKALLASWKAMTKVPMALSRRNSNDSLKNSNNGSGSGNITLSGPHFSSRPMSRQDTRPIDQGDNLLSSLGNTNFFSSPFSATPGWNGYLESANLGGATTALNTVGNGAVDHMQSFLNDTSFFDSSKLLIFLMIQSFWDKN